MALRTPHRATPGPSAIVLSLGALSLAGAAALQEAVPDGWDLRPPAPVWKGDPEQIEGLDALDCAECHADVAAEWAGTLHALAWVDPPYQKALKTKRRPRACWGCHAPSPIHADVTQRPDPRPDAPELPRELGITCVSCHSAPDGSILGPWGLETDAHASVQSDTFVGVGTVELCSACHRTTVGPVIGIAKDFDPGTPGSENVRTCVGCHMAPVERRLSDGSTRSGRSHALQTPRDPHFLAQAFDVALRDGRVVVQNRAGHRMPGLVDRAFEFEVHSLNAGGQTLARAELAIDDQAWLPPLGAVAIDVPGEDPPAAVRVLGRHADPRLGRTVEFLDRTFPVESR